MSTFKRIKAFISRKIKELSRRLTPRTYLQLERIEKKLDNIYNLANRSRQQGYDFVEKHLHTAVILEKKKDYLYYSIEKAIPISGLILEFGVFTGRTINILAEALQTYKDPRLIYGFDSFEGLSEDWLGHSVTKGHFSTNGVLPKTKKNVALIKGLVDETFLPFLKKHHAKEQGIAFMHMDMDTYTPTKYVFDQAAPYLKKGSIIIFDEFTCTSGWQYNEYKAYMEVIANTFEHDFFVFNEYSWRRSGMRAGLRILGRKKPARSRSRTPLKKSSRKK